MSLTARLVKEYNVISAVTNILNELEIILVPFVNPDGYDVSLKMNYTITCLYVMFR